jgi:hypothetical protein
MALSPTLTDREFAKFKVDPVDGGTDVRIFVQGGTVGPSGLNIGGRYTEITINDTTWTALPSTPLPDRNAISIQNQSGEELKLNYDSLEPSYVGITVINFGERHYDITDSVIIYAKSKTGTRVIGVEEVA